MSNITSTLQCPQCGQDVFIADDDGLFYDDGKWKPCPKCGTICRVKCDCSGDCDVEGADGIAYITTLDDMVEDIGQPKCDGSCGAVKAYQGRPCLWTCERTKKTKEGSDIQRFDGGDDAWLAKKQGETDRGS